MNSGVGSPQLQFVLEFKLELKPELRWANSRVHWGQLQFKLELEGVFFGLKVHWTRGDWISKGIPGWAPCASAFSPWRSGAG